MPGGMEMSDTLPGTPQADSATGDAQRVLEELTTLLNRPGAALEGPLGADGDVWARLEEHHWVNPHLPIGWPVMPRGLLPKLSAYAKKIVRVALRWYINPLVAQQNDYNEAVADAFRTMCQEISRLENKVFDLEAKLERAEKPADDDHAPGSA